jgi:hypothetical protein
MERLWENAERSAAAIKQQQQQQQQRPDSQALDYSVCSGRSSIIVSSNNVHHNNSNHLHSNGHHDNGTHNHPTSAIHQLPSSIVTTINGGGRPSAVNGSNSHGDGNRMEEDDEDTPMICMICEDKATGLHYGIITCEG